MRAVYFFRSPLNIYDRKTSTIFHGGYHENNCHRSSNSRRKNNCCHRTIKKLENAKSLHFDDYTFEGEVENFCTCTLKGDDYYDAWNLSPLKKDILSIIENKQYEYLLLDYPFAYRHKEIKDFIDCAIFIDTPLDIAMARRILRDMKNATGDEIRADMEIYLKAARKCYLEMQEDIIPSSDYVSDGTKSVTYLVNEILNIVL